MIDKGWGTEKRFVYLVLLHHPTRIGLRIPLADMIRIFTRPLKGLGAMAYAVLGAPGYLSLTRGGPAVSDAQIESTESQIGGQVFHYVVQAGVYDACQTLIYESNVSCADLTLNTSSVVVPRLSNKLHASSDASTDTPTDAFQSRVEARDPTSRSYPPEIPYNCHACHLISNPQVCAHPYQLVLHKLTRDNLRPWTTFSGIVQPHTMGDLDLCSATRRTRM
jgi:hypothetical protein